MLRILVGIETNPHWEPLNDFDKVAAGIFRGQKAEQRSGGARKILDRTSVVATERINMNVHRLTRAHVFELSFLEVRRHPDIVNGNDGKQTLSWLNPLAEFDGLASNDTTDRRIDLRIPLQAYWKRSVPSLCTSVLPGLQDTASVPEICAGSLPIQF
jgi:hypothetical protein